MISTGECKGLVGEADVGATGHSPSGITMTTLGSGSLGHWVTKSDPHSARGNTGIYACSGENHKMGKTALTSCILLTC